MYNTTTYLMVAQYKNSYLENYLWFITISNNNKDLPGGTAAEYGGGCSVTVGFSIFLCLSTF